MLCVFGKESIVDVVTTDAIAGWRCCVVACNLRVAFFKEFAAGDILETIRLEKDRVLVREMMRVTTWPEAIFGGRRGPGVQWIWPGSHWMTGGSIAKYTDWVKRVKNHEWEKGY